MARMKGDIPKWTGPVFPNATTTCPKIDGRKPSARNPKLQPYDILGTASLRARQSHKNMWKINCHRLHNHPEYQKFMEDEAALKCYGLTVLIFYNE